MYYGGTSVTCYGGTKNSTTTCPTNTLDNTAKALIDNHTWNTGAPNHSTLYNSTTQSYDTVEFYKAERGTINVKIITGCIEARLHGICRLMLFLIMLPVSGMCMVMGLLASALLLMRVLLSRPYI